MRWSALIAMVFGVAAGAWAAEAPLPYVVVDTGQRQCFSDRAQLLTVPRPGERFFGQDAYYDSHVPAYRDNGDGTVSDLNTGLMWVKERGAKIPWNDAMAGAAKCRVGGYADWRAPTIKELYSLIEFTGGFHMSVAASKPYIDTRYFGFVYGDEANGERAIDCQDWSATQYLGTTMGGNATVFGVNFADGRIKGYPRDRGRYGVAKMYMRYVRGNANYGKNDFEAHGDGTITDRATGLMWSKADSGKGMDWEEALAWAQAKNREKWLGHDDWRVPNAKELQSIVDYARAPDVTKSAAIDARFEVTRLADGEYPFYWTCTTHLDGPPDRQGGAAVYVAFGRALGWMQMPPGQGEYRLMDVHGAGAQRSDPKSGNAKDYPHGRGPQGDVVRINNSVRLVRNVDPAAVRLVTPDVTPLPVVEMQGPGMGAGGDAGGPSPGGFDGPGGGFPPFPPPPPPGRGPGPRGRQVQ